MEKRIVAIIRWLERCSKEYSAGTLESALMDVECARADIDRLRDEVWAKLERRSDAKARTKRALAFAQALFWGLMVVLAAPTPTVWLQETPITSPAAENPIILETSNVFAQEIPLKANPATPNVTRRDAAQLPLPRQAVERQTRPSAARKDENKSASKPEKREEQETHIPYERILSLVQTGERALKNTEPAIKVER